MNHYPRHIGDWMRDTAHLSEVEECIYSRLIDMYYSREKPLPGDVAQICRLVRAASKEARTAVGVVLEEFFAWQEDGWHQKRCDAELEKYQAKSAKASESASARWSGADAYANAMRTHMPTHSDGNANQNQNQNQNQEAPTRNGFANFWAAYPAGPRKVGKVACLRKWMDRRLEAESERIVAHVSAMAKTDQWRDFCPAPLTYINQSRWEDGAAEPSSQNPKKVAM